MSIPRVSPLRAGATPFEFTASTVERLHPLCPPMQDSECGSLSILVTYPPRFVSGSPPIWARKWVMEQARDACATLNARMTGVPEEIERQLRLDGCAESWWSVQIVARNSTPGQMRWEDSPPWETGKLSLGLNLDFP